MWLDWIASDSEARRAAIEAIGFLAAGTTVAAFYCRTMLPLRLAAIAANLLFILYGGLLDLKPVLALHCVLLPLNVLRLAAAITQRDRAAGGGVRT